MLSLRTVCSNIFKGCYNLKNGCSISTFTTPLCIRLTPALCANPARRKKKADPAIEKLRAERKRQRLWRNIKRLMRIEKQLKPIDEIEVPYVLIDERKERLRPKPAYSTEELENRVMISKKWSHYKMKESAKDVQLVDRFKYSQRLALDQLKEESPELYEEAIKIDESIIPFETMGPPETPPIKDFYGYDGTYTDVTKKWD